jgi:alpha-N-acetylglucosaminidase
MSDPISAARGVLRRLLGDTSQYFDLTLAPATKGKDDYCYQADDGRVTISGSSAVAICRGAYDYLKTHCDAIVTWSGSRLELPDKLPDAPPTCGHTPFSLRYYFNVVTFSYTLPYWDWERWGKEIDWMALHGLNFPLAPIGTEAILRRVWEKLGLTEEELDSYFVGPAHLPFHRMGSLIKHDGPLPKDWFTDQVALQHKLLARMRDLGIEPIVQGFAGFVPPAFKRLNPDVELRYAAWDGGFDEGHSPMLLPPDSPHFAAIGKLYMDEWKKEFGEAKYFLADTFNEMEVPLSEDPEKAREELAAYGENACNGIIEADPNAIWVMQGWLFYYGRNFWTKERVETFLSRVPNDKMLILDLANEYPYWKGIQPLWEKFEGFYGKQWVYSLIPNMGGKTCFTGYLDFYASDPIKTVNSPNKGNLVGYGTATEGLENNDVIYELITDVAWRQEAVDLDEWTEHYCRCRYGDYPPQMKKAYDLLRQTVWGSFTDHPKFEFQLRPPAAARTSVNRDPKGLEAVEAFLSCSDELKDSPMYRSDAYELTGHYVGVVTHDLAAKIDELDKKGEIEERNRVVEQFLDLLIRLDAILAHHPTHRLDRWVDFARNKGQNEAEKDYYDANAKLICTHWGGGIDDYATHIWSGLVAGYYASRWRLYYLEGKSVDEIKEWEREWIRTPYHEKPIEIGDPLEEAVRLVKDAKLRD